MRTLIAAVLLAACNVQPVDLAQPHATCGALCSSSAFCSQPPTTCRYCNAGMCSFVPTTPGPPPVDDDAGVAAEPDAQ